MEMEHLESIKEPELGRDGSLEVVDGELEGNDSTLMVGSDAVPFAQ